MARGPDPDSAGLLSGDITVGFEVTEEEVTYDFRGDLGGEELRRQFLRRRQAPEYPCSAAEFKDTVLFPKPVRKGYSIGSCRLSFAAQ